MKHILGLKQIPNYRELDQEAISPQHANMALSGHKDTRVLICLLCLATVENLTLLRVPPNQTSIVLLYQIEVIFKVETPPFKL